MSSYNNIDKTFSSNQQAFLFISFLVLKLESCATLRGKFFILCSNVLKCCCARELSSAQGKQPVFSLSLYSLKCRTYGNFGFSVSDISTYKSVHDSCAFHIRLSISYGIKLVISLLIREHFFKFPLPYSVRSKCITILGSVLLNKVPQDPLLSPQQLREPLLLVLFHSTLPSLFNLGFFSVSDAAYFEACQAQEHTDCCSRCTLS